jgi:hypothetical protein
LMTLIEIEVKEPRKRIDLLNNCSVRTLKTA